MASPYDIAIKLSAENAVSPVIALIAKDLLGLGSSVKELEKAFGRMGLGLKTAIGAAVVGAAAFEGVRAVLDLANHGEKLIHQQNIMLRNGQSLADVYNLTADAFERITKDVPTATGADALRTMTEMRTVLGATPSIEQTEFALKIDALMSNLKGETVEGAGYSIWRALEMKGLTASDPEAASKLASTMAQIASTSPGKLTPEAYAAFAKRGGAAWMAASPHLIAGAGSVLIGDMGGDTAGTAYSTFYNSVMGAAQMSRQQLEAYRAAGLIDEGKVHKIKGSSNMQMDPGAIKGVLEYSHDLDEWVANVMAPGFHAAAKKIAEKEGISEDAAYDALIAKAGRNKNTQRLMHMWGDTEFIAQIDKDRALWEQAQPVDTGFNTMIGRPSGTTAPQHLEDPAQARERFDSSKSVAQKMADYQEVMKAFQTQWESLLQAVGGPAARALVPVLQDMTAAFTNLAAFSNAHQAEIEKTIADVEKVGSDFATMAVQLSAVIAPIQQFLDEITALQNKVLDFGRAWQQGLAKLLGAPASNTGPDGKPITDSASVPAAIAAAFGHGKDAPPATGLPKSFHPGRDPRSPSTGPYSYTPPAAPVVIPPPAVNVAPTAVNVSVFVDGEIVAHAMEMSIARNNRTTNSSYDHDGRSAWEGPDIRD